MIVASSIGLLFLLFLYYAWTDLGEQIAAEIGADGYEGACGVRSGGPTATATAGADTPDWAA